MMNPNQDPNGFIMVDPLQSINQSAPLQQEPAATSKKSKRNKKKNKNKTGEASAEVTANNPKIVTLRNPLFQPASDPMRSQAQQPPQNYMPPNIHQSASIIKNENGMFTIRNNALHQALSNGAGNNFRQYSGDIYPPTEPPPPQHTTHSHSAATAAPSRPNAAGGFSYFSDGMPNPGQHKSAMDIPISPPIQPCTMAIGSELKNAQQMKSMPWNGTVLAKPSTTATTTNNANGDIFNKMSHLHPQQTRSYSPFDSMPSYGFNSVFTGSSPTPHSQPSTNNYYNNGGGGYAASNYNHSDSNSLFSSSGGGVHRGQHRCDDSPPLHDMNQYSNNGLNQSYYNDLSYLQPGRRLNSEVTIHNVGDGNFHRDQAQSLLTNGVEITRISNNPSGSSSSTYGANPNLAVGSHRQASKNHELNNSASEYRGDIH